MPVVLIIGCVANNKEVRPQRSPEWYARRIFHYGNSKKWNSHHVKYNITYTQTVSREYLLKHGGPPEPSAADIKNTWHELTGGFQLSGIRAVKKEKEGRGINLTLELRYKNGSSKEMSFHMRPAAGNEWNICVPVPFKRRNE